MVDSSAKRLNRYHSKVLYWLRRGVQAVLLRPFLRRNFTVTVKGVSHLKQFSDPVIMMSNHQSHLDALLIIGSLPHQIAARTAVGAATDNFFRNWLQSKPTRILLNTYPIDRDKSGRHQGVSRRLIDEKISILVFPEGTRTRSGNLGKFHTGLARIALDTNVKILPIAISGAFQAWPYSSKRWHKGKPPVEVNFLPMIKPKDNETPQELTERVKSVIASSLAKK